MLENISDFQLFQLFLARFFSVLRSWDTYSQTPNRGEWDTYSRTPNRGKWDTYSRTEGVTSIHLVQASDYTPFNSFNWPRVSQ